MLGIQRRIVETLSPKWWSKASQKKILRDPNVVTAEFKAALRHRQKTLVIIIDAVDQLRTGSDLAWLPQDLPACIKIVVSCADLMSCETPGHGSHLMKLKERFHEGQIELPKLSKKDVAKVAKKMLADYGKELNKCSIKRLQALKPAREPLYLAVLLRELRALSGANQRKEVIERIRKARIAYPNVAALFRSMLDRLDVFGREEVGVWVQTLMLSREGLSPAALANALEIRSGKDARLNAHRIRRAMRPYLQKKR